MAAGALSFQTYACIGLACVLGTFFGLVLFLVIFRRDFEEFFADLKNFITESVY